MLKRRIRGEEWLTADAPDRRDSRLPDRLVEQK